MLKVNYANVFNLLVVIKQDMFSSGNLPYIWGELKLRIDWRSLCLKVAMAKK